MFGFTISRVRGSSVWVAYRTNGAIALVLKKWVGK